MTNIRFLDQPNHRELVDRAVGVLSEDPRVRGLYLSGSPTTDEYSDIDLMILSTREDAQSLENERLEIARKIGEVRAEAMGRPHTYAVIYEPLGIKVDYCFHLVAENPRPDKAGIEILYDPDKILGRLVEESANLSWGIDRDALKELVKHFFVSLAYFVAKVERGELWEARDTVEWYRGRLVLIEDILAERKPEGYRRLEFKLAPEKKDVLEDTVTLSCTRDEVYRNMDAVIDYFQRFIQPDVEGLGVYPKVYVERMINQYKSMKNSV